jgi:hypothetical protein
MRFIAAEPSTCPGAASESPLLVGSRTTAAMAGTPPSAEDGADGTPSYAP